MSDDDATPPRGTRIASDESKALANLASAHIDAASKLSQASFVVDEREGADRANLLDNLATALDQLSAEDADTAKNIREMK